MELIFPLAVVAAFAAGFIVGRLTAKVPAAEPAQEDGDIQSRGPGVRPPIR